MTNEDQELLTVREVARRCHRSEETVRRWIWSGKLPARKLGNQLFVDAGDVVIAEKERETGKGMVLIPPPRLTDAQFRKLEAEEKKFRDKLFRQHGYFDTAEMVRQSREGH